MNCPCGSQKPYAQCCEFYIKGQKKAPTAEALMRARYTAHVKLEIPFLRETLSPEQRSDFDQKQVREWAESSEWKGLEILSTKSGLESDTKGVVEFIAKFSQEGKTYEHHETATFRKDSKTHDWYFVDGDAHTHEEGQGHHHHATATPIVREGPKVGRNDPCTCGSGKKFKKCCGA